MKKFGVLKSSRLRLSLFSFSLLLVGCSSSEPVAHGGLVPDIDVPSTVYAGVKANYSFAAHSAQGYKISYSVNWGDGVKAMIAATDVSSGSSAEADHTYSRVGSYVMSVTATDGHGESGFGSRPVVVSPAPPPED